MAKDCLGNSIQAGDLVQLRLDSPVTYGHIKSITDGGISLVKGMPGGQKGEMVTPGTVTVVLEMQAQFDPRDGKAPGILKCYEPKDGDEGKTGILKLN